MSRASKKRLERLETDSPVPFQPCYMLLLGPNEDGATRFAEMVAAEKAKVGDTFEFIRLVPQEVTA